MYDEFAPEEFLLNEEEEEESDLDLSESEEEEEDDLEEGFSEEEGL